MKRRTFLSLIFAPAISRADFTLPSVPLRERPPAIVFSCGVQEVLFVEEW